MTVQEKSGRKRYKEVKEEGKVRNRGRKRRGERRAMKLKSASFHRSDEHRSGQDKTFPPERS